MLNRSSSLNNDGENFPGPFLMIYKFALLIKFLLWVYLVKSFKHMKELKKINQSDEALDAFIDDCLLRGDPICTKTKDHHIELVASQIIGGIWDINDRIAS